MTFPKRLRLKKVLYIIMTTLIVYCMISMIATVLIYDSIFARYDAQTPVPQALSAMVESREQHNYTSGEHQLCGYLYRASPEVDRQALIVIAPGFQAGADSYLWQIHSLLEYGWSVFIFDPTGSFRSQGEDAVGFSQELLDLEATLLHIENQSNFGYNDLVLLGHSRGGYAACCALRGRHNISAVVTLSGIDSAMDGVIGSAKNYVGNLAYANYGFLWVYQALLFGTDTLNLSAHEQLACADIPSLVVHGATDEKVPLDQHSIYAHKDSVQTDNIRFLLWTEARQDGHTSLLFDEDGTANDALMAQIHLFLSESIT